MADSAGEMARPVSEFVRRARSLIERNIPLGWVAGEVSNLTRAASGHIYFTLKDSDAQLRCAMWRNRAQLLGFRLEEGMQVELRAQLTIYEARGDLQLSVESIRRAGQGNLFEAFLRLKARLEAEGLFANELKRPLPRLPAAAGIVTSLQAAALRDVLATLRRRVPALPLVIYPAPVQGEGAGEAIAAAITAASQRAQADGIEVLIVCRGGGSLEDLWAFNHEAVVRAIRGCAVPVVSGVGHETDTSLSDYAADLRAATPTAAAEAISAGWLAARELLPVLERAMSQAMQTRLRERMQRLDFAERRLLHPRQRLQQAAQRLDSLQSRMQRAARRAQSVMQARLQMTEHRWRAQKPRLQPRTERLSHLQLRLRRSMHSQLRTDTNRLGALAALLGNLNPEAVLQRGYAIVRDRDGRILKQAAAASVGQLIDVRLADGALTAEVIKTQA